MSSFPSKPYWLDKLDFDSVFQAGWVHIACVGLTRDFLIVIEFTRVNHILICMSYSLCALLFDYRHFSLALFYRVCSFCIPLEGRWRLNGSNFRRS